MVHQTIQFFSNILCIIFMLSIYIFLLKKIFFMVIKELKLGKFFSSMKYLAREIVPIHKYSGIDNAIEKSSSK